METANVFMLASVLIISLVWNVILIREYNTEYRKIKNSSLSTFEERYVLGQLVHNAKMTRLKRTIASIVSMGSASAIAYIMLF